VARFAYADKLSREGSLDRIEDTLELWLSFWRDVMLAGAQASAPLANPDRAPEIQRLAQRLAPSAAGKIVASVRRTGELLEKNVNTRLALEVMLLDWPRV
jgi:DNA polymerase-3 subunit delta'